jgi:hypothetical protein
MGYTTEFTGQWELSRPLTIDETIYLYNFTNTRRVKRDSEILKKQFKGKFGLDGDYGVDGEYFVGGKGYMGQERDNSVIEYNEPPAKQPGLWCQWEVVNNQYIQWNGTEKFYYYTQWIEYLIEHIFNKWDIKLNGKVKWVGESRGDKGCITINDSVIKTCGKSKNWYC